MRWRPSLGWEGLGAGRFYTLSQLLRRLSDGRKWAEDKVCCPTASSSISAASLSLWLRDKVLLKLLPLLLEHRLHSSPWTHWFTSGCSVRCCHLLVNSRQWLEVEWNQWHLWLLVVWMLQQYKSESWSQFRKYANTIFSVWYVVKMILMFVEWSRLLLLWAVLERGRGVIFADLCWPLLELCQHTAVVRKEFLTYNSPLCVSRRSLLIEWQRSRFGSAVNHPAKKKKQQKKNLQHCFYYSKKERVVWMTQYGWTLICLFVCLSTSLYLLISLSKVLFIPISFSRCQMI